MAIGTITPAEWTTETTPAGRRLTRLTGGGSNHYPLYYFVPSVTPDGRYFVCHGERTGEVQLYRVDLQSGEIGQLTDGHTRDSGWAIWCEWHVDGIYNHLSAINSQSGEVWYFEDREIRATNVATFANRHVTSLPPGRMPIGQNAFSPDGRWFAYIHADAENFGALMRDREARTKAGTFHWTPDHQTFRNAIPTTLMVVDTATGEQATVITTDYHFHHVLFADNRTLLLNHPKNCVGMWLVDIDGTNVRHIRPHDGPGAHNAEVNHQVITTRGIAYEAVGWTEQGRETWFGMYDPATDSFTEGKLPVPGYTHVGLDPAGRFEFIECASPRHELLSVHHPADPTAPLEVRLLHTLSSPDHEHQRHHAHPFLAADRRRLYFTDWSAEGNAQVCALDVADIVPAA